MNNNLCDVMGKCQNMSTLRGQVHCVGGNFLEKRFPWKDQKGAGYCDLGAPLTPRKLANINSL